MFDILLSTLAPHPCFGCNKTGRLLCSNCKYDIMHEPFEGCILCGRLVTKNGVCQTHTLPFRRAWCVGERTDTLRRLIDSYKFEHVYAAQSVLAELLSERIGDLPPETIVVPIPTASSHVRQRGYDHVLLLARQFAKRQHLKVATLLSRQGTFQQRGLSRKERAKQAQQTYVVQKAIPASRPYLLVDDIITTGATMQYAAQALRNAGAREIQVAALAYQPLD